MDKLSIFEGLESIERLLFPTICCGCAEALNKSEELICISCLYQLPRTNYHRLKDNPVMRKLRARIPVEHASAFLNFRKGNLAQILLHKLKYEGRQDIGKRLGSLFGRDLCEDGFCEPDVVIPLPLHPAKKKLRGYNQCVSICEGLAPHLNSVSKQEAIMRTSANSSQTNKGRFERWLNVEHIFASFKPELIQGKRVLLVDDVITTGATLEACGRAILDTGASELNIATLASA